jgi:hypothetical protein
MLAQARSNLIVLLEVLKAHPSSRFRLRLLVSLCYSVQLSHIATMQTKVDIYRAIAGKIQSVKVLTFSKGQMGKSRRNMALDTLADELALESVDVDKARCFVKTVDGAFEKISLESLWNDMLLLFEEAEEKRETPHYLLDDGSVLLSTQGNTPKDAPEQPSVRKAVPSVIAVCSRDLPRA